MTGTFGADQLLVPGRVHDGRAGALVLTPLRVEATGAVLPVVRGWVPDVGDPAATCAPAAPSGTVHVVGWLRWARRPGPAGVLRRSGRRDQPRRAGEPVGRARPTAAYLVLGSVDAGAGPGARRAWARRARAPAGVDWRNLGYALQWWLFGLFAVALWWRMVGDEAQGRRRDDEAGRAAAALPTWRAGAVRSGRSDAGGLGRAGAVKLDGR